MKFWNYDRHTSAVGHEVSSLCLCTENIAEIPLNVLNSISQIFPIPGSAHFTYITSSMFARKGQLIGNIIAQSQCSSVPGHLFFHNYPRVFIKKNSTI